MIMENLSVYRRGVSNLSVVLQLTSNQPAATTYDHHVINFGSLYVILSNILEGHVIGDLTDTDHQIPSKS